MAGGTLVVTRAEKLHDYYRNKLKNLGFTDVTVTSSAKNGLNFAINEHKPRLLLIDSYFYQAGTPYMTGELHRDFPKLNIAVISLSDFPLSLAPWFIWHGAKSYVSLWEGFDEFNRGMMLVREGKQYISPAVQNRIDKIDVWPETGDKITKRQKECLTMLCCGFAPERIGEELNISRQTVNNHLVTMYKTFHATNREEMVAMAWELELVTHDDVRFYEKKPEVKELPEWANVKLKMNN